MIGLPVLGWAGLGMVIAMCLALGAAPMFAVRLISLLYPKGHPRRAELVAETAHVVGLTARLEQWCWLGGVFATSLCEGFPARHAASRARRAVRRRRLLGMLWSPETIVEVTIQHRDGRGNETMRVPFGVALSAQGPLRDSPAEALVVGPDGQRMRLINTPHAEAGKRRRTTPPGRHKGGRRR